MSKKEILDLLMKKSDRIKEVIDPSYETEFPDQATKILLDGLSTRFYKCRLCLGAKSLLTTGERNTKDTLRKHNQHNHGADDFASAVKRPSTAGSTTGVDKNPQKKIENFNSSFQN